MCRPWTTNQRPLHQSSSRIRCANSIQHKNKNYLYRYAKKQYAQHARVHLKQWMALAGQPPREALWGWWLRLLRWQVDVARSRLCTILCDTKPPEKMTKLGHSCRLTSAEAWWRQHCCQRLDAEGLETCGRSASQLKCSKNPRLWILTSCFDRTHVSSCLGWMKRDVLGCAVS